MSRTSRVLHCWHMSRSSMAVCLRAQLVVQCSSGGSWNTWFPARPRPARPPSAEALGLHSCALVSCINALSPSAVARASSALLRRVWHRTGYSRLPQYFVSRFIPPWRRPAIPNPPHPTAASIGTDRRPMAIEYGRHRHPRTPAQRSRNRGQALPTRNICAIRPPPVDS